MKATFVVALLAAVACAFSTPLDSFSKSVRSLSEADASSAWVVLVAGSNGWGNYRHQSSVYHAYQLAHKAGIPDEHIIVMHYDDLANSPSNPFPGKIYNEIYDPQGENWNVYEGVPKDYTGRNCNLKNFMAVMKGEETSTGGKTLKSDKNSNVFIFYDDHGNSGIIAMPTGELVHDTDIAQILKVWEEKAMFKNLVFFMSACYSGSMWYKQQLPENMYVVTSAPTDASSYACLRDNTLKTFVTSCWPHGWLHSVDVHGDKGTFETIFSDSFYYAKNNSPTIPCQYGNTDMKKMTWGDLVGYSSSSARKNVKFSVHDETAVPQYDVPYVLAREAYKAEPTPENLVALRQEQKIRIRIDKLVSDIMQEAMPGSDLAMSPVCKTCDESCDCYKACTADKETCERRCCNYNRCWGRNSADDLQLECGLDLMRHFSEKCGRHFRNHDYILSAGAQFNRVCRLNGNVEAARKAIDDLCA
jgi:legumain